MSQLARIVFSLIVVFGLSSFVGLHAQLYPGDANNDGRVDQYDVLAIAYAYGAVGPARIESGTDAGITLVPLFWNTNFPNGDNYAYADTDGNGQIGIPDLAAVYQNYGVEWMAGTPPTPIPLATPADPRLGLGAAGQTVALQPGQSLNIPLLLGTDDQLVENLNGIAFRVRFSEDVFTDINLNLANNWLSENLGQALSFQQSVDQGIDVAISRFGKNPLTGFGSIGELSCVIVEDMIDLLPQAHDTISTYIKIEGILGLDGVYDTIPIFGDSLYIKIYHPDAIINHYTEPAADTQVRIVPNPIQDHFRLQSDLAFTRVDMIDLQGRVHILYEGTPQNHWQRNRLQFPPGCYVLRLYTDKGVQTQKIIIH